MLFLLVKAILDFVKKRKKSKNKGVITLYSYEIENYLRDHNYQLLPEEVWEVTNTANNPQVKNIKYFCFSNEYVIETSDGHSFRFGVRRGV